MPLRAPGQHATDRRTLAQQEPAGAVLADDRRRADKQVTRFDASGARRDSDPSLAPEDCIELIGPMTASQVAGQLDGGLSVSYVMAEIHAGRLPAWKITRPGMRDLYRISRADFESYRKQYGWLKHEPVV